MNKSDFGVWVDMPQNAGKRAKKGKTKTPKKEKFNLPDFNDEILNDIINNSLEGIGIIGEDYKIEYANENYCKILGVPNLIGHDFRNYFEQDLWKTLSDRYGARRRGEALSGVYQMNIIHKDGEVRTVEGRASMAIGPDGKPKIIAHLLDITEVLADSEALEESETRYQMLIETMDDGLVIDDPDGNLVYTNDAFCKMLGYTSDEIVGTSWIDLTEGLNSEDIATKIAERRSGKSESYELRWITKSGESVPTIVSATPYIDRDGKFVGTFAVITEISEQKEAEAAVQFYLDLLSHDIANQLQVIMTSSGLLEEEVPASYIDDARKDILDAVERCNRLITKVKRAAQIRYIPLSRIDAMPILKEKIKVLERVYGAKVHLQGLKKILPVEADVLLGEMIWNLLENAARHNPKDEKQVWVTCETKTDTCSIVIGDDGPGLSDMRKKTLFTERKHGGGVGLTLVSQMIRKYGGSIEVQDRVIGKPAMGTKFIVTLRTADPREKR
ncbi:MAG: PAS domain-containing sensor histidine kinase [Candidatus Thorarchaeota archaeon]|nr:PAS domain-containing sensor histidine kinase [Candidatus Thorarchaeota archaeon]